MFPDTSVRTDEEEEMDDFSLAGESFGQVLDNIASINRWLGGNTATISALNQLITEQAFDELKIIDAGCGGGDMCREIAKWGRKVGQKTSIIGIDANAYALKHAAKKSTGYKEISYEVVDIFSNKFQEIPSDVLVCTLTLHHFKDPQIVNWLTACIDNGAIVIVNDLHRSGLAYRLFQLVAYVFRLDRMNRDDGLISILRGFKRADLEKYTNSIKENIENIEYSIQWKWAFRYLWLIKKI